MRANVGDRIVRASGRVDGAVRHGEITAVKGADGGPPYRVRWADTGDEALVFPGSDCIVEHDETGESHHHETGHHETYQGEHEPAAPVRHRTWTVQVSMLESGPSTTAEATLVAGDVGSLRAVGHAQKDPADAAAAVIGDEIAAGRALRRLAEALIGQAEADIAAMTGTRGHVHT
jgi:hypothetical protein